MNARPRPEAETSDPFGFYAKPGAAFPAPPKPTMDELLRQILFKLQSLNGSGGNGVSGMPAQDTAMPVSPLSTWGPKPVTGYRIPVMPPREKQLPMRPEMAGGTPAAGTANAFGYSDIEKGANRFADRLRQEALRRVLKGEAVRFNPLSGIQPVTEAERLAERPGAALRQGPLYASHRGDIGPVGQSNFGNVGVGDFVPGVNTMLSLDDLAAMWAREDAGLDVGIGEKAGTYLSVLPFPGWRPLSKAGGELVNRVFRRLGQEVDASILDKVVKEGLPAAENAAEGKAAVAAALSRKTRVPAGMYRPDLGEIAMDYGVAGDPALDFQGGYGLSHIIERRKLLGEDGEAIVRDIIPDVLANGRVIEQRARKNGPPRIAVYDSGHKVFLEQRRVGGKRTWVVSGFSSHNEGGVLPRLSARGRQEPTAAGNDRARERSEQSAGANDAEPTSKIAFVPKPPLMELPKISYTVNPMTGDEFRQLPKSGKLNPFRIRTSQDSNNDVFHIRKGEKYRKSLLETTNDLRSIEGHEDTIPEIRVFEYNGKVFTLDHRRLVSHRFAGVPIRYRKANAMEVEKEITWKFTTKDEGMTIKIKPGIRK